MKKEIVKLETNQRYLMNGTLWGIEFSQPRLREEALSAFKQCGLYATVDFGRVPKFRKTLTLLVTLTDKGVKYFTDLDRGKWIPRIHKAHANTKPL